jgi:uncharacterized protein (TIGR03435 family)
MLDERFDIRAKAPGDTAPTRELAGLMLQSLLAGRFQLKMHREKRDLPVYLLVVAKDRLKLKPSAPGAESSFQLGSGVMTQITGTKQTMEQLAHGLSAAGLGRPVIDSPGNLRFQIELDTRSERLGQAVDFRRASGGRTETRIRQSADRCPGDRSRGKTVGQLNFIRRSTLRGAIPLRSASRLRRQLVRPLLTAMPGMFDMRLPHLVLLG